MWEVNLGADVAVRNVKIFNRVAYSERLSFAKVSLLDNDDRILVTVQLGNSLNIPVFDINFNLASVDAWKPQSYVTRKVRVELDSGEPLHLGEVQVFSAANNVNVALGKPATQSSSHPSFPASYGVDGNFSSFSHTNNNGKYQNSACK